MGVSNCEHGEFICSRCHDYLTQEQVYFKGTPVHICAKVPIDKPYIISIAYTHCPFCGIKLNESRTTKETSQTSK